MSTNQLEREKREVERLLSQISDDGPSASDFAELQALLLDRPDLQRFYARAMGLQTLLSYELRYAAPEFTSLLNDAPLPRHAIADCVYLARRVADDVASIDRRRPTRPLRVFSAALAASAAVVGMGFFLSQLGWFASTPEQMAVTGGAAAGDTSFLPHDAPTVLPGLPPADTPDSDRLVVRHVDSLLLLSRVSRTALLSSIVMPAQRLSSELVTPRGGTAWMQQHTGSQERGHLVALPPGHTMDLFVDAESHGQNAVSVVEIGSDGKATGESLAFTNRRSVDHGTPTIHDGSIGTSSRFNSTAETKYFLLTGSHVLLDNSEDQSWRLSDFEIFINTPYLTYIGWDDSGYRREPLAVTADYEADRDFDDICATIRIVPPAGTPQAPQTVVQYTPLPETSQRLPDSSQGQREPSAAPGDELMDDEPICDDLVEIDGGYEIAVAPGESVVLRITSDSWFSNSLVVAEADSHKIIWRQDRLPLTPDAFPQAGRGAYLIENHTTEVQKYVLFVRHSTTRAASTVRWETTPHRLLLLDDDVATVGFEDSLGRGGKMVDWNDVQVHVRWFSQ